MDYTNSNGVVFLTALLLKGFIVMKKNFLSGFARKAGMFGVAALLAGSAMAQIPLAETQYYAQQGNPDAQYNLGAHFANGNGVQQDYRQAAAWYGKAAQQGHPRALHDLADLHEEGLGVNQNVAAAKELSKKACSNGFKPSCDMYNRMNTSYK